MKGETNEERFKRIAEKRVQRILDSIKSFSACSNKRTYKWNNDQLKKIWRAVDKELERCKACFENDDGEVFKL